MSERGRRAWGRLVAWVAGLAALGALANTDPVITQSWRTAPLSVRTLTDLPGAAWMVFRSTSALGATPHSMIQFEADKDQTAWAGSNALFCDADGNYVFCAHWDLGADADNAIAEAIGVHGPGQHGIGMDVDHSSNTGTGIRIAQGGSTPNANQHLIDIDAEEDFTSGAYEGTFVGNFLNFEIRDNLKYRVDYQGNISTLGGMLSYATTGIGYGAGAGAGCAVTQQTNRSTGVTCNGITGAITTNNASLAAGAEATFTVTNSAVAVGDTVQISARSGQTAGTSIPIVTTTAAGSFNITLTNLHASTADTGAMIINFTVLRGASS